MHLTKKVCKGQCVLHKTHDTEKWLHKHFHFKNTTEHIIFMVWGLLVIVVLLSIK